MNKKKKDHIKKQSLNKRTIHDNDFEMIKNRREKTCKGSKNEIKIEGNRRERENEGKKKYMIINSGDAEN